MLELHQFKIRYTVTQWWLPPQCGRLDFLGGLHVFLVIFEQFFEWQLKKKDLKNNLFLPNFHSLHSSWLDWLILSTLKEGIEPMRPTLKSLICMEFFLFFSRKLSQLHALLEPPHLFISEKPGRNSVFYAMIIKKIPTTCLLIRTSTFIWFWYIFLSTHY